MKRRFYSLLLAATLGASALVAATVLPGVAFAGAATDTVKAKQTALFDKIRANDDAGTAALFDEMLDYDALARASLGSEWAARSDAEKAEFTGLLTKLVQQAYKKNLTKILNYDVEYVGEESKGDVTKVKTKAKSKSDAREEPIEIVFSIKGNKVVDIETEGVSLVSSYRSQFTKIIKKDGFPALIQKMKDKLAKGDI